MMIGQDLSCVFSKDSSEKKKERLIRGKEKRRVAIIETRSCLFWPKRNHCFERLGKTTILTIV